MGKGIRLSQKSICDPQVAPSTQGSARCELSTRAGLGGSGSRAGVPGQGRTEPGALAGARARPVRGDSGAL